MNHSQAEAALSGYERRALNSIPAAQAHALVESMRLLVAHAFNPDYIPPTRLLLINGKPARDTDLSLPPAENDDQAA